MSAKHMNRYILIQREPDPRTYAARDKKIPNSISENAATGAQASENIIIAIVNRKCDVCAWS